MVCKPKDFLRIVIVKRHKNNELAFKFKSISLEKYVPLSWFQNILQKKNQEYCIFCA